MGRGLECLSITERQQRRERSKILAIDLLLGRPVKANYIISDKDGAKMRVQQLNTKPASEIQCLAIIRCGEADRAN